MYTFEFESLGETKKINLADIILYKKMFFYVILPDLKKLKEVKDTETLERAKQVAFSIVDNMLEYNKRVYDDYCKTIVLLPEFFKTVKRFLKDRRKRYGSKVILKFDHEVVPYIIPCKDIQITSNEILINDPSGSLLFILSPINIFGSFVGNNLNDVRLISSSSVIEEEKYGDPPRIILKITENNLYKTYYDKIINRLLITKDIINQL